MNSMLGGIKLLFFIVFEAELLHLQDCFHCDTCAAKDMHGTSTSNIMQVS